MWYGATLKRPPSSQAGFVTTCRTCSSMLFALRIVFMNQELASDKMRTCRSGLAELSLHVVSTMHTTLQNAHSKVSCIFESALGVSHTSPPDTRE